MEGASSLHAPHYVTLQDLRERWLKRSQEEEEERLRKLKEREEEEERLRKLEEEPVSEPKPANSSRNPRIRNRPSRKQKAKSDPSQRDTPGRVFNADETEIYALEADPLHARSGRGKSISHAVPRPKMPDRRAGAWLLKEGRNLDCSGDDPTENIARRVEDFAVSGKHYEGRGHAAKGGAAVRIEQKRGGGGGRRGRERRGFGGGLVWVRKFEA
ncbi:hypothetical protein AXF42_Ash009132 [Apostasia shenzhenica]|uniref:Uncharacterized protein n=1 Tax=Apostasia shenzhenica TaxID=1088818 RepID=A0A2I0ADQ0_9ASPA|nr:hypothetical protein AXF42_Ash009132 [Apostasia shenzhenica]